MTMKHSIQTLPCVLLCLVIAGCATPPESAHPAAAAANPPAPIPTSEPGDDTLTCQAIDNQIAEMNGRVDQANQRTRALERSGTTGSGISLGGAGSGGVGGANVNENNYPALGTGTGSIDSGGGGNSASNEEAMAAQQRFANSAIARANLLVGLGRAKKCFA